MKIKKEFVDLIYNGEKKYEFRNSKDKEGIYKIKDKFFKLTCVGFSYYPFLREEFKSLGGSKYWINGYNITAEEAKWIRENISYFIKNNELKMYFYEWKEINYEHYKLKKLEIIGE